MLRPQRRRFFFTHCCVAALFECRNPVGCVDRFVWKKRGGKESVNVSDSEPRPNFIEGGKETAKGSSF
jgi:hypothetical protein